MATVVTPHWLNQSANACRSVVSFELTHRNHVAPFRNRDQVAIGTNVDARRIHVDVLQVARQVGDRKLLGFGLCLGLGRLLLCLV
jgi:hypothetical protein